MLLRNGKLIIWKIENNIVCFNDTVLPATCGVPRGSILRPTMLLLYVYDNYVQGIYFFVSIVFADVFVRN